MTGRQCPPLPGCRSFWIWFLLWGQAGGTQNHLHPTDRWQQMGCAWRKRTSHLELGLGILSVSARASTPQGRWIITC